MPSTVCFCYGKGERDVLVGTVVAATVCKKGVAICSDLLLCARYVCGMASLTDVTASLLWQMALCNRLNTLSGGKTFKKAIE